MRFFIFFISFLFLSFSTKAQNGVDDNQIVNPAEWSYKVVAKGEETFEVTIKGKLKKGFHIYSQFIGEGGPIPLMLEFEKKAGVKLVGKALESGGLVKIDKDPVFDMPLSYFDKEAIFKQIISSSDPNAKINLEISGMACDESSCIQFGPDKLVIQLPGATKVDTNTFISTTPIVETIDTSIALAENKHKYNFNFDSNKDNCGNSEQSSNSQSLWMIFILGFLGGLLALLTPCVFPMLPLTVTLFLKSGKGIKMALLYGLSIIVIYVTLGLIITGVFGSDALNVLATHPIFNIAFFLIFAIFALSFFGLFEISLPYSWANKTDAIASKGGLLGIFFMAFTLVLVSFSCTGPLIGTLLVEAATGGGPVLFGHILVKPLIGMLGFSIALALPFTLFAMFPQWLSAMPKSGGWMDTVKKILGFLELALAFKFLSTADMVSNWGILRIEPFLIIWMLIFGAMGLFCFGIIRFGKPKEKLAPIRVILGVVSILFTAYLATGFSYKPLKLLSGLAPPTHYNFWGPKNEGCPANLNCFHDFDKGLEYAKAKKLPILIDFTGYGCVNCRKMEETVWVVPNVNKLMGEYVLISLYVDDRKPLPENEYYQSNANGQLRTIKTVGNKWSDFQALHFKKNSQPWYVLVDSDLNLLNKPVGTQSTDDFKAFLECGLLNFKK
ncbi:MAG: thioredoxin family protein [Bacteroidetes bacterium]|nr:thioredoxin family protein [Bacteroidota bacterium]